MKSGLASVNVRMRALCFLAVVLPSWAQTAPPVAAADVAKAGTPILPGEKRCRYPLPKHRDWEKQEIWAWTARICLGEIADMSKFERRVAGPCDPRKADGWPKTRELSSEFLKTILNHEPYQGALTRAGVRIRCARFNDMVDLANMAVAHPLWLHSSRFRLAVSLKNLRTSKPISLGRSTFDGKFNAEGLVVKGSLFMDQKAHFKDEVSLLGAKVGGVLDASSSTFDGRFRADRLEVTGSLFMNRKARFNGDVRLLGAKIGSQLNAIGSTFNGALRADRLVVARDLMMRKGASFKDVALIGGKVGGALYLQDSKFAGHLDLTSVTIGDELQLAVPRDLRFRKPGNENHPPPRWTKTSRLTLRNAHVGALNDTKDAWGLQSGRLDLTGFTYGRLGGSGATRDSAMSARSNEWLLQWLAKQDGFKTTYNPQPFEQLAEALRASGFPGKADAILFAARNHQRDSPQTPLARKASLWVQWALIGYGYHNLIALVWFIGLTGLGMWACGKSPLGARLQRTQRYWYSFDMALPIVELNGRHREVKLAGWPVVYFYFHKMAGFVFVSFLIAGLSGLTK